MKAKKMKAEPKNGRRIMRGVRMSEEEWATIKEAAEAHNMTRAEYVRKAALIQAGA